MTRVEKLKAFSIIMIVGLIVVTASVKFGVFNNFIGDCEFDIYCSDNTNTEDVPIVI